jgi:hypothetical protein
MIRRPIHRVAYDPSKSLCLSHCEGFNADDSYSHSHNYCCCGAERQGERGEK